MWHGLVKRGHVSMVHVGKPSQKERKYNSHSTLNNYEQTRQLTTPKARNGHDAIPGAQVSAEIACMVAEETRRNLNSTL